LTEEELVPQTLDAQDLSRGWVVGHAGVDMTPIKSQYKWVAGVITLLNGAHLETAASKVKMY